MSFPFWTNVLNYTFNRGYIRLCIILVIPLIYNAYAIPLWEPAFLRWNAGHNQNDIWNRLEAKVKADKEAEEGDEAIADMEEEEEFKEKVI